MTRLLIGALGLALMAGYAQAQAPTIPCDDHLRTLRVLAERHLSTRQATELETAQTIAGLLKRIDALQAQLDAAKKADATPGKD